MSEKRETILRLLQDETGRITDVKIEQQPVPEPKPLTVIELKPETMQTFLRNLVEGSVVDWGDGTKSTVTAAEAEAKEVRHTYATTSTANRIVTIDGVIDRTGDSDDSPFDTMALTVVRSLGKLSGDVNHLFSFCGSLTAISAGLFDHCTAVTDFSYCFSACSSLTAIPAGLFDHCTAVTNFSCCFNNCDSLTAIPGGLFDNCPAVTDFSTCFSGCDGLTTIPEGLFDNCPAVTNFSNCFSDCISLTAIPEGLFDHCTAVTNFNSCFSYCSSLTAIPVGLFDHCTVVTNFGSCFYDCSSLTAIPEGLFDHCTAVTDLYFCFYKCSSLTAIPVGLFDHCTVVTNFFKCFYKCSSLTGETPYTIVDGKKVKLWERSPENGFVKISSDSKCFIGCTGLSDYAEIPYGWKQ